MSAPPPEQTIYLGHDAEAVCAIVHPPATGAEQETAVILCPPFGWDEVCSYRSRRVWAQRLAASGYPTVRISYPGTGDSGAWPRDPERLEAWTAAVTSAASWLRTTTDTRRTVAIGIELGGLLAYRAAAAGAPVDDLVLWGTPSRAHALIRQLRAFSAMELSEFFKGLEPPPPLPDGELEAGGFVLSAETVRDLERLDLTELVLPDAASRRALLLDRDGIAVDGRLVERLERDGASVSVAAGHGYAAMSSHPQTAQPPLEVIDTVARWMQAPTPPFLEPHRPRTARPPASEYLRVGVGEETYVKETPFAVPQQFGKLSGILTEPAWPREPGLCAVLLNAGAVRRAGPNRMWVEAARRWAERGVTTLRLDVEGIGDADGDATPYAADESLYVPELVPQVLATLDVLQERGLGDRFILAGLCAGAYWAFQAALTDSRVVAALMMNPRALVWDPSLEPARDFRALMRPASWPKLRRLATGPRVRRLLLWLLRGSYRAPRRLVRPVNPRQEIELDAALRALLESGKRALLLFSCGESLDDELVRSGRTAVLERSPNVTREQVQVRDHTLRPSSSQRRAHELLDQAVEREIEINRALQPAPGGSLRG